MSKDYKGTPPISIVAPGEAKFLNRNNKIKLIVNDKESIEKTKDNPQKPKNETVYDTMLANKV